MNMWLAVASSLRAFNTVQDSSMPNLRTKFEQSANVSKKTAFAAGLCRLSCIFNTKKRMRTRHIPLAKTAFAVDSNVAFF